jgi:uncharacterized membrane protein
MPAEQPAAAPRWAIWRSFSGLGLLLGALFFAASLTPSLIPRAYPLQGVLGGVSLAAGYGLGVLALWLWQYLELPLARDRLRRNATWAAAAVALAIVLWSLWQAAEWQNSIRLLMGMPPVDTAHPMKVGLIALPVAVLLILIGRLFLKIEQIVSNRLDRHVPRRVSRLVGLTVAVLVFATVIDGVIFRGFLRFADASAQRLDALIEPDLAPPTDPMKTGSAASLISWQDLGRTGRDFVTNGPTAAQISEFTGRPAMEPIRVYVGLNAADEVEQRAQLALDELIRVGAFDRSRLVLVVPTGTGWMDPAAMDTLDYLHGGDVASVALQYSYLTSWISILVEPGYGSESGRELFRAVYAHWTALPHDSRPELYLNGLSLGALSSEASVRLHEMIADPIQGAVWAGPPFPSPGHRSVTDERNPGSPAWLPIYGDGSYIRFTNQQNHLDIPGATWGPIRIVYLQYASDPIVFFEPQAFWRPPAWLAAPRGPDVSPELRWVPVVTFLQLLLDMAIGLLVPIGHGHLYAHAHYIDAWVSVTAPEGWTSAELDRLKAHFAPR